MKKVIIALGCVAFFGLASCKKDYTCECTTTDSSGTVPEQTVSTTIPDSKKGDAEDACNALESSIGTLSTTCELE